MIARETKLMVWEKKKKKSPLKLRSNERFKSDFFSILNFEGWLSAPFLASVQMRYGSVQTGLHYWQIWEVAGAIKSEQMQVPALAVCDVITATVANAKWTYCDTRCEDRLNVSVSPWTDEAQSFLLCPGTAVFNFFRSISAGSAPPVVLFSWVL